MSDFTDLIEEWADEPPFTPEDAMGWISSPWLMAFAAVVFVAVMFSAIAS